VPKNWLAQCSHIDDLLISHDVWKFNFAISIIHDLFLWLESNRLFQVAYQKRFFHYFTGNKSKVSYYPSALNSAWKKRAHPPAGVNVLGNSQ
jgi:hypothetical protein